MASATATATMAAAGFDKRPSNVSSLQTPASGTFPSELCSPLAGSPGFLKKDDVKTPITPPSAYLDFLKNMSPALMSPAPTSTSSRFSFHEKTSDKASSESSNDKPSNSPPTSQPALSRNTSYESNASASTASTGQSAASGSSAARTVKTRPESPRVIIPFAKPGAPRSARTPRRLQIPQSPFSPALSSAHSLHSMPSPYSNTPLSAAPWSASYSPRDVDMDVNSKPGKVSVRQVVTRTVTYCRTPLDPAPKGKRRKVEEADSRSSEEPPAKQEKTESHEPTSRGPCLKQETPEAGTTTPRNENRSVTASE